MGRRINVQIIYARGIGFFGCKGMDFTIHFLLVLWSALLRSYQFELISPPPILRKQQILLAPSSPISLRYRKIVVILNELIICLIKSSNNIFCLSWY